MHYTALLTCSMLAVEKMQILSFNYNANKVMSSSKFLTLIEVSTFIQCNIFFPPFTDITCDVIFDQNQCAQKIIIRHQMRSNQFNIKYDNNGRHWYF